MTASFNVIDEPWIVVRDLHGATQTVSLRDVFRRSSEFESLAGDLPSQDFAVLRILLAVVYRALLAHPLAEPEDTWGQWWEQDQLPMEQVDEYLDRWHHRFDLFDGKLPWFQVADLKTASGETKPVELLVPDSPETSLFANRRDFDSLSAAEAARWLVHCQAYDISGIKSGAVGDERVRDGKGYPIGPGFAGWLGGITVLGDNLRETLLLNLIANRRGVEDDLPIWEKPALSAAARADAKATGPVSLFTWPQRRVRLFPDSDGRVTQVLIANGDPVAYQFQNRNEVMSGWRYSEPQTKKFKQDVYMPRTFESGAALWRGLEALLPIINTQEPKTAYLPCAVLEWSAHLAGYGLLNGDRLTRIKTVGVVYGSQQASWDEIFSDSLAFNVQLAATTSSQAKEVVLHAVERANVGANAVARLAGNLAIAAGGEPESKTDQTRGLAYAALDQPFRSWLVELLPDSDCEQLLQDWTDQARTLLRRLGEQLLAQAGPAAWIGRVKTVGKTERLYNTGQAAAWFNRALYEALPSGKEQKGETE